MSVAFDHHPLSAANVPNSAGRSSKGVTAWTATGQRPVGLRFLWTMRLVALVALGVSGYLAYVSLTSGKVAGCGSGGVLDCSHVMTTRWSRVAGIPVGVPAAVLYALMLGMLVVPAVGKRINRWRWTGISVAALSAGLAAVWFVGLQIFAVQHLCQYCLVAHACGLALATMVLLRLPAGRKATLLAGGVATLATAGLIGTQLTAAPMETHEVIQHAPAPAAASPATISPDEQPAGEADVPAGDADVFEAPDIFEAPVSLQDKPALPPEPAGEPVGASVGLALVQLFSPSMMFTGQVGGNSNQDSSNQDSSDQETQGDAKPADEPSEQAAERKTVKILNSVRLDVRHWPLVGSPDADYFFVEMLDYTCGHCRATHAAMTETKQAYNGRLAVLLLPTPMDRECNPHASSSGGKTADACELAKLAVAVWRLHPKEFEAFHHYLMTTPPNYQVAYAHAAELVGRETLRKELDSGTPAAYIAKNVSLYNRAGRGQIPKLLFPSTSSVGQITSARTLKNLVERHVVQAAR